MRFTVVTKKHMVKALIWKFVLKAHLEAYDCGFIIRQVSDKPRSLPAENFFY